MNIVIKLPDDIRDRILTFPFLHTLQKEMARKIEESEEDEVLNIHLISLRFARRSGSRCGGSTGQWKTGNKEEELKCEKKKERN